MYKSIIGGDIHPGDLIAVSNGNDFSLGIYFGQGRGGTVQYYMPSAVVGCRKGWEDTHQDPMYSHYQKPWKLSMIYKCFINTPRESRIIKLNRENITRQEDAINIEKSKEILAQFNIPVNF